MYSKSCFVFGSNLAGRHGKGAALHARKHHGAVYGVGVGPTGNAYAIPTKDGKLNVLPLDTIKVYVTEFLIYAKENHDCIFNVTAIGCGLAGYKPEDIAPMFESCPDNCNLPTEFLTVLRRQHEESSKKEHGHSTQAQNV